jgi:hypothetical protein
MQRMWQKFVNGKDGRPVIWQPPNLPIVLWAACRVAAHFTHTKPLHDTLDLMGTIALLVWAMSEIGWGASYFRQSLGLVIFGVTVAALLW